MKRVQHKVPNELKEDEYFEFHPEHTDKMRIQFYCQYGVISCYVYHAAHEDEGFTINTALDEFYREQLVNNAIEIREEVTS